MANNGVGFGRLRGKDYMRMTEEERIEYNMLQRLAKRVQGLDDYGGRLSDADHRAAIAEYEQLKERINQREETERKAQLEAERLRLEEEKQKAAIEAEQQRIEIEREKVVVQKADVFVRMLEVAQKGGVDGDKLLAIAQTMGTQLLTGSVATVPLLSSSEEDEKEP